MNKDEIVNYLINAIAEDYMQRWFRENGIEATIEMLERNKDIPSSKIYFDKLREKGLVK